MVELITLSGFREYDARWRYGEQVNEEGFYKLGIAVGMQLIGSGLKPSVSVGYDYRSYSEGLKNSICEGLLEAGVEVFDIGLSLSPTVYFSQYLLNTSAVLMVTASHNPNGWTGIKVGFEKSLTHGPLEMKQLKKLVYENKTVSSGPGKIHVVKAVKSKYLDDLESRIKLKRKLKVVCATGNGTAGAFAPELLSRIGLEVIPLHTDLDNTFPNYNPNPESLEMLGDMANAVRYHNADLAFGFDGDGDRCGVVDNTGEEIFADKMGLLLARDLVKSFPKARFVVDIKSTSLFETDDNLPKGSVDYWKTGHSHMKRRVKEIGALAGFEKSGHYYISEPLGRGYDDGLAVAIEICRLLENHPNKSLSELKDELPKTWCSPTMSPYCSDEKKYSVVETVS